MNQTTNIWKRISDRCPTVNGFNKGELMSNLSEEKQEENLQLAENENVDYEQCSFVDSYREKRELLQKTKITKQTWSIKEIYEKLNSKKLISDTDYQRNSIWDLDKRTSFIESLFMEIMIPPIYVVEIPEDDILEGNSYEVVDGKQRLTTVLDFLQDKFNLKDKSLEYYGDIFGGKNFSQIKNDHASDVSQFLSYVLDIYVITANSPESIKYDIFARLNKGAEKLKVNEIRRAIYQSAVTKQIQLFVEEWSGENANEEKKSLYDRLFSSNDKKRFEDYGRFYRSIAFYLMSKEKAGTWLVENYNSRPREMINTVLQKLQQHQEAIESEKVYQILEKTVMLKNILNGNNVDYIIDSVIPFAIEKWDYLQVNLSTLIENDSFKKTFETSPATTANVNARLNYMKSKLLG